MIHNRHNGSFHGQKSNLKQLGPKGIRAQGAKDDQPPNSTSSPNNNTYNHDGIPSNSVYFQENKDDMDRAGETEAAEAPINF